jgi:hypothetical protein
VSDTPWQVQTPEEPLFPDLLWSRPERKDRAGRLLIIGGSTHGFATVVKSFELAGKAGIGEVKAVLPKGVARLLQAMPDCLFAEQTATGSFSRGAIGDVRPLLTWADALLLPGELTKNAETAIFVESLLGACPVPIVATGDALDILPPHAGRLTDGPVILIADLRRLQAYLRKSGLDQALLAGSTLEQRYRALHSAVGQGAAHTIGLVDDGSFLVVKGDKASLTQTDLTELELATAGAVLTAQFPYGAFETATSAAVLELH